MTSRKLFGTDGIRGTANMEPMTAELALAVGQAAGRMFQTGSHRPRVVIGKDTRLSGYMIEAALQAGFVAVGMDVMLVGPMPTPAVAMLTRSLRADLGVMISASHNEFQDNGIKLFGPDGYKLSDEVEIAIERMIEAGDVKRAEPRALGRAQRLEDAAGRYIEFAKATFPRGMKLDGLRIVVDCAHGAAYKVAPTVLWELGAEVVAIGTAPDGFNINRDCGSTHVKALRQAVLQHDAHIGIALDGDADRLQLVDAHGRLFNGDEVLYLMVCERLARGDKVPGAVGTLMTNMAVELALKQQGVDFVRAKVGDRYVLEALEAKGWLLGGEGSGHLLALDKHTTGDGLISALQVLQACVHSGKSMAQLLNGITLFPQVLVNVKLRPGQTWQANPWLDDALRAVEAELGNTGRVLIRPSGTEPLLRVMVEATDLAQANRCAERLAEVVRAG